MSTDDAFGRWFHEQRVSLGVTLREVSNRTALSNPYISQVERGLRVADERVQQRLIDALGGDDQLPAVGEPRPPSPPADGAPAEADNDQLIDALRRLGSEPLSPDW